MKNIIKIFLLCTATVSILFFLANISLLKNKKEKTYIHFLKEGIDIEIDKAFLVSEKLNNKEWELTTRTARISKSEGKTYLEGIRAKLFSPDRQEFSIYAKSGNISNNKKDIEMSGDIVVKNKEYTLKTQKLKWNASKRVVISDSDVSIKGWWGEVSGTGLLIDTQSNMLKIKAGVKAVFELG